MRSNVETAAVAWREARTKACAAPMGDKAVWVDLGSAETALTEAVKAMLDDEAEQARLNARPKLFVVHGKMHFAEHEVEACTLEEAIELARGAEEWGEWAPEGIRTITGEVVFNWKQLNEKICEEV